MNQVTVKERPILFSGPMVRALLEGRKTQTRRIVKFSDPFKVGQPHEHRIMKMAYQMNDGNWGFVDGVMNPVPMRLLVGDGKKCPYGQPGDRLWVRETFFNNTVDKADHENVVYRADGEAHEQFPEDYFDWQWSPSIHMPRWASRIDLEVVKVRVERLQDISEEDSLAEGVEALRGQFEGAFCAGKNALSGTTAKECYERLWNEINGPENWNANPWVWVIEFKRIRPWLKMPPFSRS